MSRRLSAFAVVAVIAAQLGCSTSRCGERHGLFTSRTKSDAPCRTVGQKGECFDAATGKPVPCPPEGVGMVIPGGNPYPIPGSGLPGGAYPRPNELHMPGPADMIRPPAVPFPAPGEGSLPYPSSPGVPVKGK